jgi:hypothetical protein
VKIDEGIDLRSGDPESVVVNYVANELRQYKKDLGYTGFKGQTYKASLESELAKSHQHNCNMHAPMGVVETELGDLIILVDHILQDHGQKSKIINGGSSIIQVKRETYAKKGLSARQLYLMTQWPEFHYGGSPWKFNVFPDTFAFYMFILDPSVDEPKSSIISASMLTKLLGISKGDLLSNIRKTVPFSNVSLLRKDFIDGQPVPSFFAPFLLNMACLSIGSSCIEFRRFLKQFFFPTMEEVEDCSLIMKKQMVKRKCRSGDAQRNSSKWPHEFKIKKEKEDNEIRAVRLKLVLERRE